VACTGCPLPDTITQLRGMDVAASFTKIAVKLAGDICGVPGVPILADTIVALIETCESIPKQKQVHRPTYPVDEATYTASRQNIKELQKRCINLLEVLDSEESQGPPTSKRLEGAIDDASK